jgi:hypothetical protein
MDDFDMLNPIGIKIKSTQPKGSGGRGGELGIEVGGFMA